MVFANVRAERDVLKRVTVRLLREEERGQFDYYLEQGHYLESSTLVGQWLRYVAEVDGPESHPESQIRPVESRHG